MSQGSVHDVTGKAGTPPAAASARDGRENDLTPEIRDRIPARAREIMAGRVRPAALPVPPGLARFLQREFGSVDSPPTPEAIRRLTGRLSLEAHYGGHPVACFTTTEGTLAVLAAGEQEIAALLEGLTGEEAASVVVMDSEQC